MTAMIKRIGNWCLTGFCALSIGFAIFSVSIAVAAWPVAQIAIHRQSAQIADHEQRLRGIEDRRAKAATEPLAAIESPLSLKSPGLDRTGDDPDLYGN